MRWIELTLPTAEEDLALDEALLDAAEAGRPFADGSPAGEVLRFWERPSPVVVLGSNGSVADDVDADACRADGVPIRRRCSGGGTVLLGPGSLCFSLVLSYDRDPALRGIPSSYRFILSRVAAAVDGRATVEGTADVAVAGRKISGNAQRRLSRFVLHHGTILTGLDRRLMGRYLREPPRRPDYRGPRTHGEFTADVPLSPPDIRSALLRAWGADSPLPADALPLDSVARLVREKYTDPAWIWRR
jgi:lipoate-protein ligase A